jgi:hypothetical protein
MMKFMRLLLCFVVASIAGITINHSAVLVTAEQMGDTTIFKNMLAKPESLSSRAANLEESQLKFAVKQSLLRRGRRK